MSDRPVIRQFPGVVYEGRTWIPLRDLDGWVIVGTDDVGYYDGPTNVRDTARRLDEEQARDGVWLTEPLIGDVYRMLADVMEGVEALSSARWAGGS